MTDILQLLHAVGFRASDDALTTLLKHATKNKLAHTMLLEQLVEIEQREREAKNLESRRKSANLGTFKTLDAFEWAHARSIDRDLYEHLHSSLHFLNTGDNILIRGQAVPHHQQAIRKAFCRNHHQSRLQNPGAPSSRMRPV